MAESEAQQGQQNQAQPVAFRRVRKPKGNLRARDADEEDDGDVVVHTAKKNQKNVNSFSSKRLAEDRGLKISSYDATTELRANIPDAFATATNEIDAETGNDARAVWERTQKERDANGGGDPNAYRGKNMYNTGLKSSDRYVAGGVTKGPLRASQNIRVTCRFDYQPDICKDFKDTGYCGYGDSCKFMHDRTDYKTGWQLEKEWEEEQERKRRKLAGFADGDADEGDALEVRSDNEDDLPFACFICRKHFTSQSNPVVTKCNHYFCEACALEHAGKTSKCFICQEPTHGIFNVATALLKKLATKEKHAAGCDDNNNEDDDGVANANGNEDDHASGSASDGGKPLVLQVGKQETGWREVSD